MTPIPIPTDVATCHQCRNSGDGIAITDIWFSGNYDELIVNVSCSMCAGPLSDSNSPSIAAWIIRKLAAPDATNQKEEGE